MRQGVGAGVLLWAAIFLPALLFAPRETEEEAPLQQELQPVLAQQTAAEGSDADHTMRLYRSGAVETLTVEAYLCGVLRGEMPAVFHMEALKAQTVAERTYLYYQIAAGTKEAHPAADVCDDPACCTAYLSEEEAREKWGAAFEENNRRIEEAVAATDGQVMYYEGEPIMAVFHSSSAGLTATSGEVWRADLPYLVSVESPESAETVPQYDSVCTVSAEEFRRCIEKEYPAAQLKGTPKEWFGAVKKTDTGRVESVQIGGAAVAGQELRRLFALRSTAFTVEASDEAVTFHVTGYGHGVGMSQYGANTLAQAGSTWREILCWYYTGITIGDYTAP